MCHATNTFTTAVTANAVPTTADPAVAPDMGAPVSVCAKGAPDRGLPPGAPVPGEGRSA